MSLGQYAACIMIENGDARDVVTIGHGKRLQSLRSGKRIEFYRAFGMKKCTKTRVGVVYAEVCSFLVLFGVSQLSSFVCGFSSYSLAADLLTLIVCLTFNVSLGGYFTLHLNIVSKEWGTELFLI